TGHDCLRLESGDCRSASATLRHLHDFGERSAGWANGVGKGRKRRFREKQPRLFSFHGMMLAYPLGIKVLPAQMPKRGHESIVEIRLGRSCLKEPLTIQFLGCANLRVAMDFDVLARNLDPNTSGSRARTDVEQIRELMRAQEVDWDVGYGALSNSPLW